MTENEIENKKQVWLVWTGQYSDKDVAGVFDREDAADAAVTQLLAQDPYSNARKSCRNMGDVHPIIHPFECWMDIDGTITFEDEGGHGFDAAGDQYESNGKPTFYAAGTSKEHARKNCADFRRACLAGHAVEEIRPGG
jgi:hypothetical protein